jgi:hypothetical protein
MVPELFSQSANKEPLCGKPRGAAGLSADMWSIPQLYCAVPQIPTPRCMADATGPMPLIRWGREGKGPVRLDVTSLWMIEAADLLLSNSLGASLPQDLARLTSGLASRPSRAGLAGRTGPEVWNQRSGAVWGQRSGLGQRFGPEVWARGLERPLSVTAQAGGDNRLGQRSRIGAALATIHKTEWDPLQSQLTSSTPCGPRVMARSRSRS